MANKITKEQAQIYNTVSPLLSAAYKEIQELAKKKPDGPLNQIKVAMINRLLVDIKALLAKESSSKYLDLLDDKAIPAYSDVALTLSQYKAALEQFQERPDFPNDYDL